jgi:ribosomal-protein-alanine N-acetyltransferase
MTVREAGPADHEAIRGLFEAYLVEEWHRPWPPQPPPDDAWLADRLLLVAEEDGEVAGALVATLDPGAAHVNLVFVRPDRRRGGLATELLREFAVRARVAGTQHVELSVDVSNTAATAIWRRLGFTEFAIKLSTPLDALESRLSGSADEGPSYASIHVQTDDVDAVVRAVRKHAPRGSAGSAVSPPRNGWTTVYDELAERDQASLRRLARDLSNAVVAVVVALAVEGKVVRYLLLERGNVVDEYLSVPEHYGPLVPGDVVALAANPTAVARLTGADPGRVRQTAKTAKSPEELPPAAELAAALAAILGLEGAGYGHAGALEQPGVTAVEHG